MTNSRLINSNCKSEDKEILSSNRLEKISFYLVGISTAMCWLHLLPGHTGRLYFSPSCIGRDHITSSRHWNMSRSDVPTFKLGLWNVPCDIACFLSSLTGQLDGKDPREDSEVLGNNGTTEWRAQIIEPFDQEHVHWKEK